MPEDFGVVSRKCETCGEMLGVSMRSPFVIHHCPMTKDLTIYVHKAVFPNKVTAEAIE